MLTMLLYVLIVGLVAALLFLVASAVFGRSEELGPLPEGTTVTVLPVADISGRDVRALRFQQVFRGYKAGEVDWALSRLAARIDELEGELALLREPHLITVAGPGPQQPEHTTGPAGSETTQPETTQPETTQPETTQPDPNPGGPDATGAEPRER